MDAVPIVQDAAKKPQANAKRARCHPLVFSYDESPSGIDSNLLILLHGLGDTNLPFQRLGKQLAGNLPQTAVLSLRGASAVPFLDQPGYSWWQVWDDIGQEIDPPNPSTFLSAFSALLDHLTAEVSKGGCGWPASAIHLFGFGQGASAALEGAIRWTQADRGEEKKITELDEEARSSQPKRRVGSIISICGGLVSTPVLLFHRHEPDAVQMKQTISTVRRAFSNVTPAPFPGASKEKMPGSKAEWDAIMTFWSQNVRNRSSWELEGQVFSLHGSGAKPTADASIS